MNLEKITKVQNALFDANIVNTIEEIKQWFEKLNLSILELFNWTSVGKFLEKLNINYSIWWIDENIWNALGENIQNELKECIWKQNASFCIKEALLKNSQDLTVKKFFVALLEKNLPSNHKPLLNIFKKIFFTNNEESGEIYLTDEEKKYIFEVFFNDYKENFIKFLKNLWCANEKLEETINNLFDFSKNTLTLPNWKELKVEKNIYIPSNIKGINELFDLIPQIELKLEGKKLFYLKYVFPEYFEEIKWKTITKDTKYTITLKNWEKIEGYIAKAVNKEYNLNCESPIEIYSEKWADLSGSNPVNVVCEDEIDNINTVNNEVLELQWNNYVAKLILNFDKILQVEDFSEKIWEENDDKNWEKDETQSESFTNQVDNEKNNLDKYERFEKEWNKLEWDKNVLFEKWAILTIKWNVIKIPWIKKNWYNIEIVDVDKKNWIWKVKPFWWLLDIEWGEKVYELPIDAEKFKEFKYINDDAIFKYKKVDNVKDFYEYINNVNLDIDSSLYEKTLNKWKRKVQISGDKLVDENWNEIKYIWKVKFSDINPNEAIQNSSSINEFFDGFKVEIENWQVKISYPYGWFSRTVDYNAFLMILMDNQLEPWTESEFKTIETNYTVVPQWKPNKFFFRYSIWNIIFSFKEIMNAAKAYFKDEDDFRAAEMLAWMSKLIPEFIPFVWDIALEANAEIDAKIWKKINSAKDRLQRADKWWNHAKVAAKIIEKEIFKPVLEWKKLSYKKQLRAAGYLLYALEKWPGEYFRALANYAGKWFWVKALFWETHYQKWKKINDEMIRQLKADPSNETLRNNLVFSEIFYMKDIPESITIYSSNFAPTIEWNKIDLYSGSKVQNVYEWEAKKANYYVIYNWWKSYILNNRPPNSLWALKAITERVEEEDHYVDYYKVHLLMNLTWYVYNDYNTGLKENYDKICRTYAIPIGLYASSYDGLWKTLTILDYIVKTKWIKPWWKETLTEYLYWVKDPFSISPLDIKLKSQRSKIMSKMEKFWEEYWEDIVKVLDYRDPLLLKNINLSEKEKEVLEEYFNQKVNDPISEDFAVDKDLFKTGYAPYYTKWIFNLSKKWFTEVAGVVDGEFKSGSIWKNVWKSIKANLWKITQEVDEHPKFFDFVFSKYKLWLDEPYKNPENNIKLLTALLIQDESLLNNAIIDLIKDKYGNFYNQDIPEEMQAWLEAFIKLFQSTPYESMVEYLKKHYSKEDFLKALDLIKKADQIKIDNNRLRYIETMFSKESN